jgi:thiamine pyrophosphokinase
VLEQFAELKRETASPEKDATDGELAIRYALAAGCDEIEIYGGVDTRFETDQMLANVFMLMLITQSALEQGKEIRARLTDHYQHIYLVSNARLDLEGKPGNKLSIIPLELRTIVTVRGTKWELDKAEVSLGSSLPLRNEFAGSKATIDIDGLAIVVHRHSE